MPTDSQSGVSPPENRCELRPPGQLWQVPVFVLGVLALAGVWASRPLWNDPDSRFVRHALLEARNILEDPRAPANQVPGMMTDALARMQRFPERAGEAHFLLGRAYTRLAGPIGRDRNMDFWRRARAQLELASQLGVPDGDVPLLHYLLGKAWFQTDADARMIIAVLAPSIDAAADDRAEGYALLTQAYLRLPVPDVPHALEANQKQLDQPAADENLLAPARLLRGELLLRTNDRDAARKALARISPGARFAIVAKARRLQARSWQDDGAWPEAARIWEAILADKREQPSDLPYVLFSLGWCYRNMNRSAEAAGAWERVAHEPGAEGQAACLRLADLLLEGGKRAKAIELLEEALARITKADEYQNSFVSLARARRIVESGCAATQEAGDFPNAQKLARLNLKLAAPPAGQVIVAQVAEAWAAALVEQAKTQSDGGQRGRTEENARIHFCEAGAAFDAASDATTDKTGRLTWLWRAAHNYAEGANVERATDVLKRYIKLGPPDDKLAEAFYRLGRAIGAANPAEAIKCYKSCIASPPSPFAFRARYQLAMISAEANAPRDAEELLQQNLKFMLKDRDPKAHEASLYAIAELQFKRGDYSTAADNWKQALDSYPNHPGAALARFGLGTCYYRLAGKLGDAGLMVTPTEDVAKHYQTQRNLLLDRAVEQFQRLVNDLEARRARQPLQVTESALLEKALFGVADCRFDRAKYDDAIRLYQNLVDHHQRQVEGLVALRRLYFCYLMLPPSNPEFAHWKERASAILISAEALLRSLDDDAFRNRDLSLQRTAWETWLIQAKGELQNKPPGKE